MAARPDLFSALIEDTAGKGMAWLLSREGETCRLDRADEAGIFFEDLRHLLDPADADARVTGVRGLVYAAYEAGGLSEQLPAPKTPPGPLLYLLLPAWSIGFDRRRRRIHLCSRRGRSDLDMLEARLAEPAPAQYRCGDVRSGKPRGTSGSAYKAAVRRVKAYIRAGDVFQVNIARFWRMDFPDEAGIELYGCLRRCNPAPFSAWLRLEGRGGAWQILSASPERLFRLDRSGRLETRPIAGTRKRGAGRGDKALRRELLLSPKERAEHIMLVDLERNDLGRVCVPGSIEVDEAMTVERYATVQHIVSNVRGRLAPGKDWIDVLRAMFPGGTITGCPKVRSMEIIHELEDRARGPYTGGIACVRWDGEVDMNILIRTFWLRKQRLHWAAGAGIVADSDPDFELAETEHKAAGMVRALDRFLSRRWR